jgi:hypothetical protein
MRARFLSSVKQFRATRVNARIGAGRTRANQLKSDA